MAVTVFQSDTLIPANTDTQLMLTQAAGRKGLKIQLQAQGFLWISIDATAAQNEGFRIRGWQIFDFGILPETKVGNGVDFNTRFVIGRWDPAGVDPPAFANVRLIEAT